MTANPWLAATGGTAGPDYARRFAERAAAGEDLHGEARRVDALARAAVGGPVDVLDAGCGTGRVAIHLAELGHRTVGVDLDLSMLDEARAAAPQLEWVLADLTDLRLGRIVDVVVAAGNLVPLLTPGTLRQVIGRLAEHLRPGGLLISGFGLDDEHVPFTMPEDVGFPDLGDYDDACAAAGLVPRHRSADWEDTRPYTGDGASGYAVIVHSRLPSVDHDRAATRAGGTDGDRPARP